MPFKPRLRIGAPWINRLFRFTLLIFVQVLAAGAILAFMGFIALLAMPLIIRRFYSIAVLMMPVALMCSLMTVRSEILVALLLAYLAIELFPLADIHAACAALFAVLFGFKVTVSRRSAYQSDDEAPNLFPFFASFASRAPPVF